MAERSESESRTALLRRQGLTESGFAVLTAALLVGGSGSPAIVLTIGAAALWMALRGRRMVELSDPLSPPERRELDQLAVGSRQVRDLVGQLGKAGQQPVRWDLERCRKLARVESLLNGRT
ncbi:MAG: hypothetical protein EHM87_09935 [Burkholderiales bacterium]|nr:MAG: hypothetical protein EHM87_09935 [Burkholderiales bacterium]